MAWAPYALAAGSALMQSQGSKKAAGQSTPQIPAAFRGGVSAAMGPIFQRLSGGTPMFGGLLGGAVGSEGFSSALENVLRLASGGINQDVLGNIEETTAPLADIQRGDLMAGVREGAAARGGLFSTGALNTEADALNRFEAQRRSDLIMQAIQAGMLSLSAFQPLQSEFNRVQPDTGINLLAALMGGTPFQTPNVATNFAQSLGNMGGSLMNSPGFWEFLAQRTTPAGGGGSGGGGGGTG